jgi:L-galactose dehydrogenase
MEYRQLGETSLRVSILGYGASPLGNAFRVTDPVEGKAAVHLAVERGINYFDVSPYYGLTLAETRLGEALVGLRQQIVLATKCGRYGANQFDFSAARITASIDESLARLRTDYVDLLQAHDVEFGDARQIVEETVPAMRKLQAQGKARFIGITGYSLKNLMAIAAQVKVDTILTYCRYNLMIDDMDSTLIPFAKQNGIGIINASHGHHHRTRRTRLASRAAAGPRRRQAHRRPLPRPRRRRLRACPALLPGPPRRRQHPGRHVLAQTRRRQSEVPRSAQRSRPA